MALDERSLLRLAESLEKATENITRTFGRKPARADRADARERATPEQREEAAYDRTTRKNAKIAKNLGEAQARLLKATEELTKYTDEQISTDKELRTGTFRGIRALKKYERALSEASSFFNDSVDKFQDLVNKPLYEQYLESKELNQKTHGLTSKLAAAQKNASMMSAAFLETHKEIDEGTALFKLYVNDLRKSISDLDSSYLKQSGFMDKTTDELRENLKPSDFADLRAKLGQTQAIITENLTKIGVESLSQLVKDPAELEKRLKAAESEGIKSASRFNDTMLTVAKQLELQGFKISQDLSRRDNINYAELAREIDRLSSGIDRSVRSLDNSAVMSTHAGKRLAKSLFTTDGLIALFNDKIVKTLASTATITAGLAKAADAAKKIYKEIVDFNIAQIPASYKDVQLASIKLGMSFEETVKYLQENKRTLALYGVSGGDKLSSALGKTFKEFGYNFKQASEVIGPAIDSAISTGIDIRNGDKLNKFINKSMESFQSISGIVDITAKDYMKLNSELLGAQDIQGTLLGMDRERAEAYSDQLIALRNNYVQMGLSTQQAQELIKTQEAQKREKVTTRVREGAKAMVLAQQVGMSPEESQRYFQLSMKGMARTAEEDKEFTDISKRIGKGSEEKLRQAYDTSIAAGMATQTMLEALRPEGEIGKQISQSQSLSTAERANIGLSDEERKRTAELAKGNVAVAKFSDAINSIISLINNNFTQLIFGAGLAVTALGVQSLLTARAIAALGASATGKAALDTLGDIPDGGKGKGKGKPTPGKPGGGGWKGKAVGVGGTLLGAGLLGYEGMSSVNEAEKQQEQGQITEKEATVKKAGALGMIAGGGVAGAIGAGVGQVLIPIPGVGAAIGAAIAGWLGAKGGQYLAEASANVAVSDKNKDKDKQKETPAKPAEEKPTASAIPTAATTEPGGSRKFSGQVTRKEQPIPGMPATAAVPTVTPSTTAQNKEDVNTEAEKGKKDKSTEISKVVDTDANEKLASLVENMATAVKLLQEIVDKNISPTSFMDQFKPQAQINPRAIPSAFSYVTGRAT